MINPAFAPPAYFVIAMAAWLATGLYFIISAFAAERIRQRESRTARSKDALLLLGGYVLLFANFPGTGVGNQPFDPPAALSLRWAGLVLALAGLAFTCWGRRSLGKYWSRVVALKDDHKLVQTGPYRWVRHPLYTGLLAASFGTALTFDKWQSLLGAALLWTGFISRAFREDALLATQFGPEFADYRTRTGRLLPRARA